MTIRDPISRTARWIAAVRAVESRRTDRLFNDPFAESLAGADGHGLMEQVWRTITPPGSVTPENPYLVLRTRFLDDFVLQTLATSKPRQIVSVAAGLDCRAYRLSLPPELQYFELDRPEVLEFKETKLQELGANPTCELVGVPVDLTTPWADALLSKDFDPATPSLWIIEGLLTYLTQQQVQQLLAQCTQLAAPGSKLFTDVMGAEFLTNPVARPVLDAMAELGAPFVYGTDEPEELLAEAGWQAVAVEPSDPAVAHGRWTFPVQPRGAQGLHSFFVTATRTGAA